MTVSRKSFRALIAVAKDHAANMRAIRGTSSVLLRVQFGIAPCELDVEHISKPTLLRYARELEGALAVANPHDFHTPRSSYTKEDLLQSARGGYFGPGNAQLPAPPMLMMDRITEISLDGGEFGRGHVVAELDIRPDLWFFPCHFVGDPVMPGCLGLDAMWQVIGYWLGWSGSPGKGRAIGGEVDFRGHVTPETRLVRYEVDLKQVRRGKLAVGVAHGRLFADDVCAYTASALKVGMITPKA